MPEVRSDSLTRQHPELTGRTHFVVGYLRRCIPPVLLRRHFEDVTSIAILAAWQSIRTGADRMDACRAARRLIRREIAWAKRSVDLVAGDFDRMAWSDSVTRGDVIPASYFARCPESRASVLRMTFEDDLDRSQIVELTGLSRKAVECLYRRGCESVRRAIAS